MWIARDTERVDTDETKLPVKSVCEAAPKSLLWAATWEGAMVRLLKKPLITFYIRLNENSKSTSSNSLSPLGTKNKDSVAALQTSLTEVSLRPWRTLARLSALYNRSDGKRHNNLH